MIPIGRRPARRAPLRAFLAGMLACAGGAEGLAAEAATEAPGCALVQRVAACTAASGNGYELRACHEPALEAARDALAAVLQQMSISETGPALTRRRREQAQQAWQRYVERDCEAVWQDWSGGSMQRGVFLACQYRHTLQRAQQLWERHLALDGGVPDACRP